VSESDNCHFAGTIQKLRYNINRGKERLMRKALRRPRKTDIEAVDMTCWGRLFQVWAAATGKARSLTVDIRVRRTFSDSEEEERRHLRGQKSAVYSSSSVRYDGAVPCRHLYTSGVDSIDCKTTLMMLKPPF